MPLALLPDSVIANVINSLLVLEDWPGEHWYEFCLTQARDAKEGADIVMVKPAYPYLDIVRDAKELCPDLPIAIYQVSGEYAMLYHAAENGVFSLKEGVMESLLSARRAGATVLITYFTPLVLDWLSS
jgi:porphobilinogen synthase